MIWLDACPRCQHGAVYLDVDDLKHCVHCGFVQYRAPSLYIVEEALAASDRSDIEGPLPAEPAVSA